MSLTEQAIRFKGNRLYFGPNLLDWVDLPGDIVSVGSCKDLTPETESVYITTAEGDFVFTHLAEAGQRALYPVPRQTCGK